MVAQLVRDYESDEDINKQLDKMLVISPLRSVFYVDLNIFTY